MRAARAIVAAILAAGTLLIAAPASASCGCATDADAAGVQTVFVGTPVDVDPYDGDGPYDRIVIFAVAGSEDQTIAIAVDGLDECAPGWALFENLGVETVVHAEVIDGELAASHCLPASADDPAAGPADETDLATDTDEATAPEPSPATEAGDTGDVSVDDLRSASATASAEAAEERPIGDDPDVVELAVGQDPGSNDAGPNPWVVTAVVVGILGLAVFVWDYRRPKWSKHAAPRHASPQD